VSTSSTRIQTRSQKRKSFEEKEVTALKKMKTKTLNQIPKVKPIKVILGKYEDIINL